LIFSWSILSFYVDLPFSSRKHKTVTYRIPIRGDMHALFAQINSSRTAVIEINWDEGDFP